MTFEIQIPFHRSVRGVVLADASTNPAPQPSVPPRLDEEKRRAEAEDRQREERRAEQERELLKNLLDRFEEVGHELRQQQSLRLEEMQQVAVELAVAVAEQLTHAQIATGQYGVEELVRKVVREFEPTHAVTVYLNPDDLALLKDRLGKETLSEGSRTVHFGVDGSLERGDCRAESADAGVRTRLAERLAGLRETLLQSLATADVERRKPAAERPLGRFPDRRETA